MRHDTIICLFFLICLCSTHAEAAFPPYYTAGEKAATWLTAQQNTDGSWGSSEAVKSIYTSEVVRSLQAFGLRNSAYYQGVAWLENHHAVNFDVNSRKALVLYAHGDNISGLVQGLEDSQDTSQIGRSGWGVSSFYQQDPLDTALALGALQNGNVSADLQAAINVLKSSQMSGTYQGWPLGTQGIYDPFSTAIIIEKLSKLISIDSSLINVANNALTTLTATVSTSSPRHLQALAAKAALALGNDTAAAVWINHLAAQQSASGDIGSDILVTAWSLQTFSASGGLDVSSFSEYIDIPDSQLKKAINQSLGRNSQDGIRLSDLYKLETLDGRGMGITDLTGLEYAENLNSADLRDNHIASTTPIDDLDLTALLLDGNPVSTPPAVPAVSSWGLLVAASLLVCCGMSANRRRRLSL